MWHLPCVKGKCKRCNNTNDIITYYIYIYIYIYTYLHSIYFLHIPKDKSTKVTYNNCCTKILHDGNSLTNPCKRLKTAKTWHTRNGIGVTSPCKNMKTNTVKEPSEETIQCLEMKTLPSNDVGIQTEKSTLILVAIVCFFVVTHSFRLSLKILEFLWPSTVSREHFVKCILFNR